MKISDNTRISELISANKASIEVLASVAKPFHRLKNPILRKVMASRVTIAEAAKMGGCTVSDIATALIPLGFEYELAPNSEEHTGNRPTWLRAATSGSIGTLDVRPIIENGTDPLKEILGVFGKVPPGGILCLVNSFIPTPLIHLLKQEKAEDSYVEKVSEQEFHTYFLKKGKDSRSDSRKGDQFFMDDDETFSTLFRRFPQDQIREIDVSELEMPLPMQIILRELEKINPGNLLFVHHKRVPVYLLEELTGKGVEVHVLNKGEGNVKMLLFYPEG